MFFPTIFFFVITYNMMYFSFLLLLYRFHAEQRHLCVAVGKGSLFMNYCIGFPPRFPTYAVIGEQLNSHEQLGFAHCYHKTTGLQINHIS